LLPTKPQARRIPLSRHSHIIGFQALATGVAFHESALERDFATLTSFLEPSAIIRSQPVTIVFEDCGLRRRYTPDFLVQYAAGAELIEIKYEQDLKAQRSTLAPAFQAAGRWARKRDAVFRVVTERDIRGRVLDNAKRLLPLRALPIDAKAAMLVLTRAHSLGRPTFSALVAAVPDRSLALATIWRLIARRRLQVDLSVPNHIEFGAYSRMSDPAASPELSVIPEPAWAEARRCFPVIQRLANTRRRTRAQVIAAAAELGLSCTQVYERLNRFLADPRLTSLLPRSRGPTRGGTRLPAEINQLIDEAIETLYLTRQRPKLL